MCPDLPLSHITKQTQSVSCVVMVFFCVLLFILHYTALIIKPGGLRSALLPSSGDAILFFADTCVPPWCSSCSGGWFSTSRCSQNTARFLSRWASLFAACAGRSPNTSSTSPHLFWSTLMDKVHSLLMVFTVGVLTPYSCWSTTTSRTGSTTVCRLVWAALAWHQRRSSSSPRSSSGEFLTPSLTRYKQFH